MMAVTKKEFKYFTIMDYDLEAEYLSEMHAKGWKFTKITFPLIYNFEECQPEQVIYQLDYNQEGRKNKKEYVQMFADCGWEYLMDFVGYSYFRKPVSEMQGEEEIFCDDASRLDLLHRIFVGRIIPLFAVFALIVLPRVLGIFFDGSGSGYSFALTATYMVLFLFYIAIFIQFGVRYYKFRKRIGR